MTIRLFSPQNPDFFLPLMTTCRKSHQALQPKNLLSTPSSILEFSQAPDPGEQSALPSRDDLISLRRSSQLAGSAIGDVRAMPAKMAMMAKVMLKVFILSS